MVYLAIDPGSHKAGIAVGSVSDGCLEVLFQGVVSVNDLRSRLEWLLQQHHPQVFLIGAGTGHKKLLSQVREWFPEANWERVDEAHTTLLARKRYFQAHPPRGWRRLIPRGLLTPPVLYDDFVALILIERAAGLAGV